MTLLTPIGMQPLVGFFSPTGASMAEAQMRCSWSSELRRAILDALSKHAAVLVDLSAVSYIDSSGIAALVEGYQTAKGKNARFGLLAISDAVKAVLELARLDQVFPIYADLEAAG